jgi:hypothetical protein
MNLRVLRVAAARVALAAAGLVAVVVVMAPATSRADVCVGGDVKVTTAKRDARLTTSMPLTVVKRDGDVCNLLRFDATAHGWVQMGERHFRVHSVDASDIGTSRQPVTLSVPSRNVSAARLYAKHHDRHYAYLRLFVTISVHGTGGFPQSYEQRSRVTVR